MNMKKMLLVALCLVSTSVIAGVQSFHSLNEGNKLEGSSISDFTDGVYFIYNVATEKYLAAGDRSGTHAIVNNVGIDFIVTMTDGKYTLDSQISNGGDSHYLNGVWMDSSLTEWTIVDVGNGKLTIGDGEQFLTANSDNIVTMEYDASDASYWKLVTLEERLAKLNTATILNGVDATFLIKGANFGRNDSRNSSWNANFSNYTLSGGNDVNNVAEFYHATGTISQVLANAPAGNYKMTAQGFYRNDGNDSNLPYFFANNEKRTLPLKTGAENSMSDASESFTNGLYTIEPIYVTVDEDGLLSIGVKNDFNMQLWAAFDNFQLVYYGNEGDIGQLNPVGIDMTNELANPDFEQGEQGWNKEAVNGGNVGAGGLGKNLCFEAWNNDSFDIYQTIDSLPVGIYEITVQGFSRYLAGDEAYRAYRNGNANVPVYIYSNDNLTPFKNVFDEPIKNSSFYQSDDSGSYYYENSYTGCYFPNSMATSSTAFTAGMYQNSIYGVVFNEGDAMRIGVKGNTSAGNNSWAIWDNFKLTFWDKTPIKISEAILKSIDNVNIILNSEPLSNVGVGQLTQAIVDANIAKDSGDGEIMFAALKDLYKTINNVLANEKLEQEDFTFDTSAYNQQVGILSGNKATLYFDKSNGSSTPTNNDGIITVYYNNTLTINSEDDIVDVAFFVYDDYDVIGEANMGNLTTNHWRGNASSLMLTNTNNMEWRISRITVTFDNPSDSVAFVRLQEQLQQTDLAIANLVYGNVPGREALQMLADSVRQVKLTDGFERGYLKSLTKSLLQRTEAMVLLDGEYQQIAGLVDRIAVIADDNRFADPQTLAEANAYCEEVTAGLADGNYLSADLLSISERLKRFADILSVLYLTLKIDDAGSLGDLILERVENFTDVLGLRVIGSLNSVDMDNLKNRLTNIQYLDMAKTDVTVIPSNFFEGRANLKHIVLPDGLTTINQSAFEDCISLGDIDFPASLRSIGNWAFENCRSLVNVIIPEGVTTIGKMAFYSERYPEYYSYAPGRYTGYNNLTYVYLPGTLTSLGSDVFANNTNLKTVCINEGITSIPSCAFQDCTGIKELQLPNTLESIESYAFQACTSLNRIVIPERVTAIGDWAFINCDNLTSMTCKAVVPPSNNNGLMGGMESECTLTVPNLSLSVYKQTSIWDRFNIVGADYLFDDIYIDANYRLNWPDSITTSYSPKFWVQRYGHMEVASNTSLSAELYFATYDNYMDYYKNLGGRSDAYSGTLINMGNMRADLVELLYYQQKNIWDFISLPFDAKVSDITMRFDNTPFVIRKYDGQRRAHGDMSNTWVDMKPDSILHAGQGYIMQSTNSEGRSYNVFDFYSLQTPNKNNIFTNDDVEVQLAEYQSEFPQNRSWNLIGNPYPCYYDTRAIDVNSPITVWNAYSKKYVAYSPLDDSLILRPGEAFFIQRPVDQSSIIFLKEGRQANYNVRDVSYFAPSRQSDMTTKRFLFNLVLSDDEHRDRTRFVINADAQMGYELDKDASKFMGEDGMELYTLEQGVRLAINERPLSTGTVLLGAMFAKKGIYTISLDTMVDNEVYLIDHLIGKEVLLDEDGYTFEAKSGTMDNRFEIHLGMGAATGITTIGHSQQSTDNNVYSLQGIRVKQPKDGLYIYRNGKKVVVK